MPAVLALGEKELEGQLQASLGYGRLDWKTRQNKKENILFCLLFGVSEHNYLCFLLEVNMNWIKLWPGIPDECVNTPPCFSNHSLLFLCNFFWLQEFEDNFDDEIDFTPPAEDTPSVQSPAEVFTLSVPNISLPAPSQFQSSVGKTFCPFVRRPWPHSRHGVCSHSCHLFLCLSNCIVIVRLILQKLSVPSWVLPETLKWRLGCSSVVKSSCLAWTKPWVWYPALHKLGA